MKRKDWFWFSGLILSLGGLILLGLEDSSLVPKILCVSLAFLGVIALWVSIFLDLVIDRKTLKDGETK